MIYFKIVNFTVCEFQLNKMFSSKPFDFKSQAFVWPSLSQCPLSTKVMINLVLGWGRALSVILNGGLYLDSEDFFNLRERVDIFTVYFCPLLKIFFYLFIWKAQWQGNETCIKSEHLLPIRSLIDWLFQHKLQFPVPSMLDLIQLSSRI